MSFEIISAKPGEDISRMLELRKQIFGYGEDDLDEIGVNILLEEDGEPVAVGRVVLDMESDRIIIEMIGVVEGKRRQGIGTKVLDELVQIALKSEAETIWAKSKMKYEIIDMLEKHGFEELNSFWMTCEASDYR